MLVFDEGRQGSRSPNNGPEPCVDASSWVGEHGGETLVGQKLPCGCPGGGVSVNGLPGSQRGGDVLLERSC